MAWITETAYEQALGPRGQSSSTSTLSLLPRLSPRENEAVLGFQRGLAGYDEPGGSAGPDLLLI